MSFFRQPKPRRFHHEPIYYDEHRDRVKQIEQNARKELGMQPQKGFNPDDIRGAFSENVRKRRKQGRAWQLGLLKSNTGAIIVIILVLLLVWLYLSR